MQKHAQKISNEEWKGPRDAAWKAIMNADYKKAIEILTPIYKKYPKDFRVINFYTSTLADYGEFLPERKRKAFKKRGCELLSGLLKRLRGIDRAWSFSTRNEYYYHSAQYDKQYYLGLERARSGDKTGYYSQGVGSAWHAYSHAKKGRIYFANIWARRSVRAWANYFKFKADYYNAYVHYALALGILGRTADMETALNKSAKLSGKPDSYHEFKDVRTKISELRLKGRFSRKHAMSDDEVYDKLLNLFKGQYLGRQWQIHAQNTPVEIKKRHGDAPLKQLRSLMILTANHHLADSTRTVEHELWNPRRPLVGKRLMNEAWKLPLPGYKD